MPLLFRSIANFNARWEFNPRWDYFAQWGELSRLILPSI